MPPTGGGLNTLPSSVLGVLHRNGELDRWLRDRILAVRLERPSDVA
jgi:hypothetical protein